MTVLISRRPLPPAEVAVTTPGRDPALDPDQRIPDDPAELLPDAPHALPPPPVESSPDDPGGDPDGVPEPA